MRSKMNGMADGMGLKGKRSAIWISAVLYVLMTSILMVVVLEAGLPLLVNMKEKAIFMQTKDNFASLNQHIEDVGSAGPGSQRLVPINIKKGYLKVDNEKVKWYMDTQADVIEPMTKLSIGNLKIASDSDVDAYESGNYFILENFYMRAVFNKIGNSSSYSNITSTNVIDHLKFKGTGGVTNGTFTLLIDSTSLDGNGYTSISNAGYDMATASVSAFLNSTSGLNYTITFTLHGDADFLTVNMQ